VNETRAPYQVGVTSPRVLCFRTALPPASLGANRTKGHAWQSSQDDRETYRSLVYTAAVAAWFAAYGTRQRPMQRAMLTLRFVWCHGRRALDLDNALSAWKSGQDALVRARILENDSWIYLAVVQLSATRCPRSCRCGGRVEITLQEVTG
jgi:hypothetical protein